MDRGRPATGFRVPPARGGSPAGHPGGMARRRFTPPPTPEPGWRPTPQDAAARVRDLTAYRWGRIASIAELTGRDWEAVDVVLLMSKAHAGYGWTRDENGRETEHGLAELSAAFQAEEKIIAALGQRYGDVREITHWHLSEIVREAREEFEAARRPSAASDAAVSP
jgi:hypothetical protein